MLGIPRPYFSSAFFAAFLTSALFALALPASGGAAATSGVEGSLAPELEQLSTPALAEASPEAQAEAIGLPAEGPGSLSREGERVVVEAHFEGGALARLEALEAAGAKILVASRQYQTVALSVEPEDLKGIAAVPGVAVVAPSRRPMVYGVEGSATSGSTPVAPLCKGGSVVSRGVEQLNVKAARESLGVEGAGVTVGVLSDSFNSATEYSTGGHLATHAREDEETNDLPGPLSSCEGQKIAVNVIEEAPKPAPGESLTDEGRAMAQVIHDLAPKAQLAFATAYSSELEFAHNIERLAEPVADGGAGAQVIVDDVAYFGEPFFQEGPVANAIRRVTEAGITYLTAAGNNNLIEASSGHEIASWERNEFVDAPCPVALGRYVLGGASSCLNFSPTGTDSTFGITVKGQLTVDLQWAEPWNDVETDLNAYLLSPSGHVLARETFSNAGRGSFPQPSALLTWETPGSEEVEVQLVIDRCVSSCNWSASPTTKPRVKVALMENGEGVSKTEYPESDLEAGIVVGPTIFGHAGSPAAITLGAIRYSESATEPREPEHYSSRGPVVHYFAPVHGTTPAARLPIREVIEKPNLTATDCAATTFFSPTPRGEYQFCGTSEAAPHAAAVAALMKGKDPLAGPSGIARAMEASATAYPRVTACQAVGAGLLDASGALEALALQQSEGTVGSTPMVEKDCESALSPEGEAGGGGKETSGTEGESEIEKETPITPNPPPPSPAPPPAPVVSVTKGPASVGNESRPTFEFSASQTASFTCQIDGAAPQPCSSPYVAPTALSDGQHGFAVVGTNAEGRSGASNTYYFTVDTKAPRARIVGHPAKLVKTRKATYVARFRLTADQSPVTYYCQVDREPLRICGASMNARVKAGSHVLKVRARDELGNTSVSPATYRFRVKRVSPPHPHR
jgi:Subtilase family